jgi:hypothetical protein
MVIQIILWPVSLFLRVNLVLSMFFLYLGLYPIIWLSNITGRRHHRARSRRFRHYKYHHKVRHRSGRKTRAQFIPTTESRYIHDCHQPVNVTLAFCRQDVIFTAMVLHSGATYQFLRQFHRNAKPFIDFHQPFKQITGTAFGLQRVFSIRKWFQQLTKRLIPLTETCRRQQTILRRRMRRSISQSVRSYKPHAHSLHRLSKQRTAMQSLQANREAPRHAFFDTDSYEVLIDNGCSNHVWNRKDAFIEYHPLTAAEKRSEIITGIAGHTIPDGKGTIKLNIEDDEGQTHNMIIEGVRHLPKCPINLLVPQQFCQQRVREGDFAAHCDTRHDGLLLEWTGETGDLASKFISLSASNVGIVRTAPGFSNFGAFAAVYQGFVGFPAPVSDDEGEYSDDDSTSGSVTDRPPPEPPPDPGSPVATRSGTTKAIQAEFCHVIDKDKDDKDKGKDDKNKGGTIPLLESDERLLMEYHERLGHLPFEHLQALAHANIIPKKLLRCQTPKCPGCLYGKAHRRPWRSKRSKTNQDGIKKATISGGVVSVDQLESPVAGFVGNQKGRPTTQRYRGATVFADHWSGLSYVHLMTSLNGDETIEAKQAFERFAAAHGVRVQHYHADNGRFAEQKFLDSVKHSNQTISFCGVGAHHQNGIAERRIKDLTESSRTMLLHAQHRWPKTITANLWPQALKHAVNIRNAIPRELNGSSPLSKFSGTDIQPNMKHFHPFGCPVYVLESALQSAGAMFNKWIERARVGIFLCHSPNHAASVPLVMSTQTGLVSPQFHVVYDDDFATVKFDRYSHSLWQQKAQFEIADATAPEVDRLSTTLDQAPGLADRNTIHIPETLQQVSHVSQPLNLASEGAAVPGVSEEAPDDPVTEHVPIETPTGAPVSDNTRPQHHQVQARPVPVDIAPSGFSRSGRRIGPPRNLNAMAVSYAAIHTETFAPFEPGGQLNDLHPLAALQCFAATKKTDDPDTMTLERALREPDADKFIAAMERELLDHVEREHWEVIPISQVPRFHKPIPMVWSMKRKRDPMGEITKWKARLCAHGGMSVYGDTYWDTYSPVVSWSTVRLVMILALILNWEMRSIDFIMAFPQADVKTDIYMLLPKGTKLPKKKDPRRHLLKLKKNLYGLKDAGLTWFEFIKKGLLSEEIGFKQSTTDPCLFIKDNVLLTLYVDDAAIFSPSKDAIDKIIKLLQKVYDLTDDGELKDYLGVRIERDRKNGTVKMTQRRIIDRCLEVSGFPTDPDAVTKTHDTPADPNITLHKDELGVKRKQDWIYRSSIGCLTYLQGMSRPEIAYAVHQGARFSNDPKLTHEQHVKRICRYLRGTRDEGLIFSPKYDQGFQCYVDADFAGNWNQDHADDPACAYSRSGYVVTYAGCPIIWGSKLQTLVALSTTEAELIALSTALKEVIHLMKLLEELREHKIPIPFTKPKIRCKVFEDNAPCIEIAKNPKFRPRTKHLCVRLFHFVSYVQNKQIDIVHVSTKEQIADIFTKALPRDQFRKLRMLLMGW